MRGFLRAVLAVAAVGTGVSAGSFRTRRNSPTWEEGKINRRDVDTRYFKNFIVVPEVKLLFCTVEKAGVLSFNTLFRIIRNKYDKQQLDDPFPWRRNSPKAHNLTDDQIIDYILDPAWHKAVFVRDPLERYVSAYRSKCLHEDGDGAIHCQKQFGVESIGWENSVWWLAGFDSTGTSDIGFDPHFTRQINFCGGLDQTLQHYHTVEQLDRGSSHQKVSRMLARVNVDARSIDGFEVLFPDPGNESWKHVAHNTDAHEELEKYFDPEKPWLAKTLLAHYEADYRHFNISKPERAGLYTLQNDAFWSESDTERKAMEFLRSVQIKQKQTEAQ